MSKWEVVKHSFLPTCHGYSCSTWYMSDFQYTWIIGDWPVQRDPGVVPEPEHHVDLVVGGGAEVARELRHHALHRLHVHCPHSRCAQRKNVYVIAYRCIQIVRWKKNDLKFIHFSPVDESLQIHYALIQVIILIVTICSKKKSIKVSRNYLYFATKQMHFKAINTHVLRMYK